MPEEQELKLSVTLDDKASAQLSQLQQTLLGIAGSTQNTSGLNNFANGLRNAGQHASSLHGSLTGMAARGGFVGGFFFEVGRQVHQMAEEFIKATLDVKKYADEMVRLDQNAQRAATSMAQFRSNVTVFRESGIAAAEAEKMLKGYAGAMADLQRQDSRVRQQMLAGQRGESAELMKEMFRTVETGSQQQGIEAIRAHGQRIREFHESQGQAERGAAAESSFYARLGMPGLEKVRGQLREVTAAEKKMYQDRDVDTKRFQTALEKQATAGDDIVKSLQSIAFQLLPINAASETLAHWWESISKFAGEYERNVRRAKTAMENMPGGLGEGGFFPTPEQVLARIKKRQAWEIITSPPPVDQAPGGTFRGGGTYSGGGVYGSDVEPDVARTPLPGETPIPSDWLEQARKEQAAAPNRNPYLRSKTPSSQPPPGYRRASFIGEGASGEGGGAAGGGAAGGGSDLQRAYEENIEQIDDLTEEFRQLNYFFQTAALSGFKPGDVLAGGRGRGPGGGSAPGSGSPDTTDQSSPTQQTSTTASGPTPPGHEGPLPAQVPWPEPSAGNVIPPGLGTGPGTGPVGGGPQGTPAIPGVAPAIPGQAVPGAPWTGTVAPGAAGPLGGGETAVPPGWGPGGSGQPWSATPGGGANQFPAGSPEAGAAAPGGAPGAGPTTTAGRVGGATDQAIVDAAKQHGLDPNFMRAIADIESSSNPGSNRNKRTQYKGLYQLNQEEFNKHGGGDLYSARDNANAAAKLFAANRDWFKSKYGRDPSDAELYMMHQQGKGFITKGTMTNIAGNLPPGLKGPQTKQSFQEGWAARIERGKQAAIKRSGAETQQAATTTTTTTATTAAAQPAAPPAAGTTAAPPAAAAGSPPAATTAAPAAGATANPGGGTPGVPGANVTDAGVDHMLRLAGYSEHNPQQRAILKQYLKSGGGGIDPKDTPWCASIVNASLAEEGRKGSGSLAASSFLNWGTGVKPGDVKKGDVLVTSGRQPLGTVSPGGAGLHVGRATGRVDPKTGKIEMISGNQGDRVQTKWYHPSELKIRRSTEASKTQPGAQPPGTVPPSAYPGVPFINLPGLGPKPVTSDIIAPQASGAPQTVSDTAPADTSSNTISLEGTTLRPGAGRTDPGTALDARTLDSTPSSRVDVNGTGRVTIDVKNDPRFTTHKDEPLSKDVPISKQSQMTPASPTGAEANAEE